jgi:hypothetical protein
MPADPHEYLIYVLRFRNLPPNLPLTKTLEHVSTEMSLHVFAYNFKRVMQIVGMNTLMQAMQA